MRITGSFTDHPASVGQSYFDHFKFAVNIAFCLLKACFACLAHAVYPPLFENTASVTIGDLHSRIEQRKTSELIPSSSSSSSSWS
ncbi:MAG: hypothetical protein CL431_06155 [Acidimicrobiaceae bacterium]|jgi:hypothetical protein|nr:hypothetical protein [Acidimicrobiaceae bacterium]